MKPMLNGRASALITSASLEQTGWRTVARQLGIFVRLETGKPKRIDLNAVLASRPI